ncbi:hypothetical protein I541_0454 [Mycobacteroides abscessus]|nr:hypothetical protein I541_0454 [Mycobacteroides abscessus]
MGALGWLLAVVAILAIASRWVRSSWSPLIGLTAGFPPTCLLAILGLVFFLVVRQWWGVLTAVVVIALQALAIAPMYLPDSAAEGTTVTVLQANLRVGAGDAGAVVAAIREHDVGVVTINELTPEARAKLVAAGIDSGAPVFVHHRRTDGAGHRDLESISADPGTSGRPGIRYATDLGGGRNSRRGTDHAGRGAHPPPGEGHELTGLAHRVGYHGTTAACAACRCQSHCRRRL